MGYSSFTLEKVKKQFNLYEENITFESPIFALIEAKDHDIDKYLG